MDHRKWETYLSLCRKVESGGRGTDDSSGDSNNVAFANGFIETFRRYLPPPARVLVPGGMYEAVALARLGYEVYALVMGPDNVAWLKEQAKALSQNHLLVAREHDIHDLDYPAGFFDGYFSIQTHEHLLAPMVHIGEVRHCLRDGAIVFVDAAGTTNPAMRCAWHTNLVPAQQVLEQWQYWGFVERWRGSEGDDRPQFVLEMLNVDDPRFVNSGYLKWILRLRAGEQIAYDYHCEKCGR